VQVVDVDDTHLAGPPVDAVRLSLGGRHGADQVGHVGCRRLQAAGEGLLRAGGRSGSNVLQVVVDEVHQVIERLHALIEYL
jgi:hypothetical protein